MQPKAPAPRPPENKKRRTSFRMSFLVRWKRFELHSIQLSYQRRCKIYTTTDIGVCQLFFPKKMNFFRGAKKPEKTPACRGRTLSPFGPGAPAAPSLSNAGTAFSSPPEAAPAFPSLAGRATAVSPPPGTGPVHFPAGGRHGPCFVPEKKARLCPALPFCRARRQGCTPAKTKSPATPEGVAGPVCFAVRR